MFYYFYLSLAILFEIAATSLLKLSQGFSKLFFGCLALMFYGLCFFFLSLSLKGIQLNLAYAIWSGIGLVGTTILSIRDKSSYCRTCFIEFIKKDSLENGELYV